MRRKSDRSQILKFERDTQGMTNIQKFEYLKMSGSEMAKYVASLRSSRPQIKEENKNQKDIHIKIIKEGHVCVHVLNMRGKSLMPTSPGKARFLLKKGKAIVVKRNPFTIQLKYPTGEAKQPIIFRSWI